MIGWLSRLAPSKQDRGDYGDLWGGPHLPSFSDVLPYGVYDPTSGLYELPSGPRSNALGFLLEGLPQVGVSEQMEGALQDLPGLLGEGACLQVSIYSDPEIRGHLARYCRTRPGPKTERGESLHRRLARRRFDYVEGLSGQLSPCDFRLFFGVSIPGSIGSSAQEQEACVVRQSLETTLAGCSIPTRQMDPKDLVQLVGGLVNPRNPSRRELGYDPSVPISEQCVIPDTSVSVESDSILVRGDGRDHALVAMTASSYPASMRLAGMVGLLGDPSRSNLMYAGPFMITMCMMMLDQEAARALVSIKSARATSNAKSSMARLMPGFYRRQQEDWHACSEALDSGGGMALMSHHVIVQSDPEKVETAQARARSVWRSRGFGLTRCEYLQMQGLLAAMPMSLTPALARDLRSLGLMTMKTTHNAAHGLPVIGEWKGTRNPSLLLVGRRGQLMGLDLFDSPGNYNAVVAGISGSGKSVLLNEIAASSLGMGAKVWIFDIGCSYLKACELLGGQSLRFSVDTKLSLNPFSAVIDIDEDMRLLKPLFAQMIAPKIGLSDYQSAQLEAAIKATWLRGGRDSTPTDLQASLAEAGAKDARLKDMAAMLEPYTTKGVHGRWFEGPATVDFDSDLVVIELEELKGNPNLQSVIMMQLLFFVTQEMYSSRERRKLVLIDEAWEMLRGENVAEFIEHGYRRARKYLGSFLAATQSVADFYSSPAGRNAIANSDWMLLLSQKDEELRQVIERGHLSITPAEREMIRTLRTVPGSHSEIFVRCEGMASGVGRLAVDAHTELLFSTNAHDHTAIEAHRSKGLDLERSIQAVLDGRGGSNA